MTKKQTRKLFPLKLTEQEKQIIAQRASEKGMSSAAYIRFMVFQPQEHDFESTRAPLANHAVPEVNMKTYRQLCGIANNLNQITNLANGVNNQSLTPINVDPTLLNELLSLVKKIGLQLASHKY